MSPAEFPGALLADPTWLADRIDDTGARWAVTDRRVAATLWWYSASSTLLAPVSADLVRTGTAPDPSLTGLTVAVTPDGALTSIRGGGRVTDPSLLAAGLREALGAVVDALAEVSGAAPAALWAVASDSLGNRALEAGAAAGSPAAGSSLAARLAELVGPPLPRPRFVDVGAGGIDAADPAASPATGTRRYLRRNSCCLIYRAPALVPPGDDDAAERAKCVSCPHQLPEVRHARLTAL
ncbi:(2Fe-2S)-binding protein [Rhodococcus sp. NPDC003318]|uniref:(2Fe-2S)-binding protein n=1 Tax=Rhodococcus sp. NPDC003318 TaxID=3364503 RepID=UPI00367899B9